MCFAGRCSDFSIVYSDKPLHIASRVPAFVFDGFGAFDFEIILKEINGCNGDDGPGCAVSPGPSDNDFSSSHIAIGAIEIGVAVIDGHGSGVRHSINGDYR